MSDQQATEEFLRQLPELEKGSSFQFACHPGISCFNACCTDLNLVLSPYDVLRLRRCLSLSSDEFHARFTDAATMPESGFPLRRLRMQRDARASCPFLCDAGCAVYGDRPGACRTYPLGRTAELDGAGQVVERLYVVRESHCEGFAETPAWTGEEWLRNQGLTDYNACSDRYLTIISRYAQRGTPLTPKQLPMVDMALYRLDSFGEFLRQVGLLERMPLTDGRRAAILADEAEALRFGMDWLDLILFRDGDLRQPPE